MTQQELDKIKMNIQAWQEPRHFVGAEESLIDDIKLLLEHIDDLQDEIRIEEEKREC